MKRVKISYAAASFLMMLLLASPLMAFDLPGTLKPIDTTTVEFEAVRAEASNIWSSRDAMVLDRGPLEETRNSKLATLGALAVADFFQSVSFLYQVPMGYTNLKNIYPGGTIYRYPDGRSYTVQPGETLTVPVYRTEANPILGDYPTRGRLMAFGAAGVAVTAVAAYLLPAPWGDRVLNVVMHTEMNNVVNNNNLLVGRGVIGIPIVFTYKIPVSWL